MPNSLANQFYYYFDYLFIYNTWINVIVAIALCTCVKHYHKQFAIASFYYNELYVPIICFFTAVLFHYFYKDIELGVTFEFYTDLIKDTFVPMGVKRCIDIVYKYIHYKQELMKPGQLKSFFF